jgi:hypothetical protein
MRIRSAVFGFIVALLLSEPASYALQEFTLEEARTRIERLEARVTSLEAMIAAGNDVTPGASETHTVTGTVLLVDQDNFSSETPLNPHVGETCTGRDDYSDIEPGAPIHALDEAGSIVGLSSLPIGEIIFVRTRSFGCKFSWTIEVEDTDFYVFEIADREGPTYSRADLEEAGWTVELSIGE